MRDTSVYKVLSHNDTGRAKGHQAGIVIPASIAPFFPRLAAKALDNGPTVDVTLTADLFVDGRRVDRVQTRYQHQTWNNTRSPERRLTDNLGALRNKASQGDILLFSKDLDDDQYISLHLLPQGTLSHSRIAVSIAGRKWGAVYPEDRPVSVNEMDEAEAYLEAVSAVAPSVFDSDRGSVETTTVRRARDKAFRSKVLAEYADRCAFTGRKFISPVGARLLGLDAAHVVPVSESGSDHPANGLPLTKELHWAFDRGMIGVASNRKIVVPERVRMLPGNEFLRDLHGQSIREARHLNCRVVAEALEWHRDNLLVR